MSVARTHPDANGGRQPRPCEMQAARVLWAKRGVLVIDTSHPALTMGEKRTAERLGAIVGIIDTKVAGKAARIALEEADAVFGGEDGSGQNSPTGRNGGDHDGEQGKG